MNAEAHFADTPGGGREVAEVDKTPKFEEWFKQNESQIVTMLPTHVRPERFANSALTAVKQNPDLLAATPRSLFIALTRSAQDGLLPDGREGIITVYNTKQKNGTFQKVAQWNPMTAGIRKRARELDHIIVDAQVVHENDHFVVHLGDVPHIEHHPPKLGQPRGKMVGAYAIFKREDGVILHREIMDATQIETTRQQSKDADSLMWRKFPEEGYRKTVVRRGSKSVPCSESLTEIIRRDDENFDFDAAPALVAPPAPPPAPPVIEAATSDAARPETETVHERSAGLPGDWQDYLDKMMDELVSVGNDAAKTQAIRDTVADTIDGANSRGEISASDVEAITARWEEMADGL